MTNRGPDSRGGSPTLSSGSDQDSKPSPPKKHSSSSGTEFTCVVHGCPLTYKSSYNTVAFKLETLVPLIGRIIPVENIGDLQTRNDFIKEGAKKTGFVSWSLLKDRIEKYLHRQALRDMLSSYQPFKSSSRRSLVKSLSKDQLKLFGMDVGFVVSRCQVFFEILGAFTIVGELGIPMRNKWETVDAILQEHNVSHRDAFRRQHKWTWTQRSHISVHALSILVQHGTVQDPVRKATLVKLFRHLESEINRLSNQKQALLDELETIVNSVKDEGLDTKVSFGVSRNALPNDDGAASSKSSSSEEDEAKAINIFRRCCSSEHFLSLGKTKVQYVIFKTQIFLEKCSAFSSLGRLFMVRGSDYRKADKLLSLEGYKTSDCYLMDPRSMNGDNEKIKHRQRRTHISLEAFKLLVDKGFAFDAKKGDLLKDLGSVYEKLEDLRQICHQQGSTEFKSPHKEESSVCKQKIEENTKAITILNEDIRMQSVGENMFLHVEDMKVFFENWGTVLVQCEPELNLKRNDKLEESFISSEDVIKLVENKELILKEVNFLQELKRKVPKPRPSRKRKLSTTVKSKEFFPSEPSVTILETVVPCQVVKETVYLEEKSVLKVCKYTSAISLFKKNRSVDKLIEEGNVCLDDAFLYEGRRRTYISTEALKILIQNGILGSSVDHTPILRRLGEIDQEKDHLRTKRVLHLETVGDLDFQVASGMVYLNTLQLFHFVGFDDGNNRKDKLYPIICKLLRWRGMSPESSFLRQGKSRYVFIALDAALALLQTRFGPFKDRGRMLKLRDHLLERLQEIGYDISHFRNPDKSEHYFRIQAGSFAPLYYKTRESELFLHRKTCFDEIGLEHLLMSSQKALLPVHDILQRRNMTPDKCFISGDRDQFEYISLSAFLTILESQDPIVNVLEKKEKFTHSLMMTLQSGVGKTLRFEGVSMIKCNGNVKIPYKLEKGKIFLHRQRSFALAGISSEFGQESGYNVIQDPVAPLRDRGMDTNQLFLSEDDDVVAFISIDALLTLLNLDGGIARGGDYSALKWNDVIAAVLIESPRLKVFEKILEFRQALYALLNEKFIFYLYHANFDEPMVIKQEPGEESKVLETKRPRHDESDESEVSEEAIQVEEMNEEEAMLVESLFCDNVAARQHSSNSVSSNDSSNVSEVDFEDEGVILSEKDFQDLKAVFINASERHLMGEWIVERSSNCELKLALHESSSSSKKQSFIDPGMCAMLRYQVVLKPLVAPQVLINDLVVPQRLVREMIDKSLSKGGLYLLYAILTLRPCFGCYSTEIMETIGKAGGGNNERDETLYVDRKFQGTGCNGRTYAGTVRSTRCRILAENNISDTCNHCKELKNISVNRSLLINENATASSTAPPSHQKSIWQVQDSSQDGCTFVCPQWQSFNYSLPKQFPSNLQATTVVEHKVHISEDLKASLYLNGHPIERSFPEFEASKQVGPLLEWVSTLRICVGYPDPTFVSNAKYLLSKKHILQPEVRVFFENLAIDANFSGQKISDSASMKGTVRSQTCRFVANDYLCDQCRLLQEPVRSLGVRDERKKRKSKHV